MCTSACQGTWLGRKVGPISSAKVRYNPTPNSACKTNDWKAQPLCTPPAFLADFAVEEKGKGSQAVSQESKQPKRTVDSASVRGIAWAPAYASNSGRANTPFRSPAQTVVQRQWPGIKTLHGPGPSSLHDVEKAGSERMREEVRHVEAREGEAGREEHVAGK